VAENVMIKPIIEETLFTVSDKNMAITLGEAVQLRCSDKRWEVL
jgi:hypothetical protein